ncbi:MAG: precorrin-3B C(17)-methyltransferase [Megasphaera sp.]|jgi:precorrin-3B C17-methyltransferase|nr:precorrin-3B C(17)-methyltransferase [Megasphaera sp.]MCH4187774.1 precorrin-3B C(17)-methyltransferase [Megasphaera sp.]MCH4217827.1 precorrin-3B C(17)-methyltransferase [Megasphaera sp.]
MNPVIYVVGIGPGCLEEMTIRARKVLEDCDCIIGYNTYIKLIREYFPGKEFLMTGMTKERDRCQLVLEKALQGKKTALVSSGDAGVYGMAGIMHEVAASHPEVTVTVVAGITAACSGAALLGAPLVTDFCLISLSDLLTPWEKIAKRLACAAQGDFGICLYNPSSKKRADYLQRACQIILQYQSPSIPAGVVRNIGRADEAAEVMTLGALQHAHVDMFSTVLIGNSQTRLINGRMVTPRGYAL